MKVNFDQLFFEQSQGPLDQQFINQTLFPEAQTKSINLNSTLQTTQIQEAIPITHHQSKSQPEEQPIQKILEYKIAMEIKYEEERARRPAPNITARKRKNVNISELTSKLYNHPSCVRKECLRFKKDKDVGREREAEEVRRQRQRYKLENTEYSLDDILSASDRMHNYAMVNKIKKMDLRSQFQKGYVERSIKNIKIDKKKPNKYLQKYVPFYLRLDSQVRQSRQKYKIYQTYPQLANPKPKPQAYIPKKYKDIKSRYMQQQNRTHLDRISYVDDLGYSQSLNTSVMSVMSLDRSVELVNSVEEYFFQKMKCIFADGKGEYVEVGEEQIMLLSQVQFKILQEFIMGLEGESTRVEEFQDKLRNFYQNLQFRDKQELRIYQTKAKKHSDRNKNKPLKVSKSSVSTTIKPLKVKNNKKVQQNYAKLSHYV